MNIGSENVLVRTEENVGATRRDKADVDTALVELGKVSDTQGGWLGNKMDSGNGLVFT